MAGKINVGGLNPPQRIQGVSKATGEVVIYESQQQAQKIGGFQQTTISQCLKGKKKSHGGFVWTRID